MYHIVKLLAALKISPSEIGYNGASTSANDTFADILTLVYTWAGIIGIIILMIAGYLFVTSRGDAAQMKRSKDAIRGAVIGLVVVIMAFVITQFVLGRIR